MKYPTTSIRVLLANSSKSYTYRKLAQHVYGDSDPSAAQLASVRRSVGKLVAEGIAERDEDRDWNRWNRDAPTHERRVRRIASEYTFTSSKGDRITVREYEHVTIAAGNPGETKVRRARADVKHKGETLPTADGRP